MQQPFEIIPVTSAEVICDGGNGPLGHPRVFLHIRREEGQVTCPYCSRQFVSHAAEDPHAKSHYRYPVY